MKGLGDDPTGRKLIGETTDGHSVDTVLGRLKLIEEHLHYIPMVYPLLADPVRLTAGAAAWAALPTPTEIIPAGVITSDFDIHNLGVSAISAAGDYIIAIFKGAPGAEVLVGYKEASRSAVNAQEGQIRFGSQLIDPNTRISGAISSGNAAADFLDIKIEYHIY